jgi:peptidoglycan/xylan/chitin deacetylase (PgdA/CDA1 family)
MEFTNQIKSLDNNFYFVDGRKIYDLTDYRNLAGKKPVWITFDDGYSDHFNYVFPELLAIGAVGSFFVPTKAIFERKLLDVNKVHILLSLDMSTSRLISQIEDLFDLSSGTERIGRSFSDLRTEYSVSNLLNDADTRFVKLFLQQLVHTDIRKEILNLLFSENVKRDESAIVDEIYMTPDQVKQLFESGMNVGSHGHEHSRFEFMSGESQKLDVETSINYLNSIGIEDASSVFCYPHGSFDEGIKSVLRDLGCKVAVSVIHGVADIGSQNIKWLELPRIDTKFFDKFINGEFD